MIEVRERATTNMAAAACVQNCTNNADFLPYIILIGTNTWNDVVDYFPHNILNGTSAWHDVVGYFPYKPWIFALIGSTMVGLTGVFPLWVFSNHADPKTGGKSRYLSIINVLPSKLSLRQHDSKYHVFNLRVKCHTTETAKHTNALSCDIRCCWFTQRVYVFLFARIISRDDSCISHTHTH